jgi:hypothetical protein
MTTVAAFAILFVAVYKKTNIFALTITSLLFFAILAERTDLRPEIFSFLFLAAFTAILYKNRQKSTKLIFLLPLIELLWVNMHIYFAIGELLIGLFLLDYFIANRKKQLRSLIHDSLFLILVLLLTFIATLINPNGITGALYPLNVFHNYGYSIQENQNIFFLLNFSMNPRIIMFLLSACLLFTLLFINLKRTKPIDWFLAIIFTILAATAIRNLVLFVFITFIPFTTNLAILTRSISSHLKGEGEKMKKNNNVRKFTKLKIATFSLLFLAIIWEGYSFLSQNGFGPTLPPSAQPAADFFLRNHLKGPIFNNFDIGSYLDYRLYPKEKVFVDGRPEAYPAAFLQTVYIPMQEDMSTFESVDQRYHFNTIFFAHTDQTPWAAQFVSKILNNPNWILVYLDDQVLMFVKNTQANQNLIKQFGMTRQAIKLPNLNEKTKTQLMYLANIFIEAGWEEQEIKIDEALLTKDENFCPALSRLATIYARTNNPSAGIYAWKYQQHCQ